MKFRIKGVVLRSPHLFFTSIAQRNPPTYLTPHAETTSIVRHPDRLAYKHHLLVL